MTIEKVFLFGFVRFLCFFESCGGFVFFMYFILFTRISQDPLMSWLPSIGQLGS